MLYALVGTFVCTKIDALYGSDDIVELMVDGILITFWPLTVIIHFLLDD
jgi:hypothetical protein